MEYGKEVVTEESDGDYYNWKEEDEDKGEH